MPQRRFAGHKVLARAETKVTPEVYIVRVYRRMAKQPRQIAGLVETPGGSRIAKFLSFEELTAILRAPRTHLRRRMVSGTAQVK